MPWQKVIAEPLSGIACFISEGPPLPSPWLRAAQMIYLMDKDPTTMNGWEYYVYQQLIDTEDVHCTFFPEHSALVLAALKEQEEREEREAKERIVKIAKESATMSSQLEAIMKTLDAQADSRERIERLEDKVDSLAEAVGGMMPGMVEATEVRVG